MMHPIRCSSCSRQMALSFEQYPLRNRVYCSVACVLEKPPIDEVERGDQWEFLRSVGYTPFAIATMYEAPHGQVYKTLDRLRDIPWDKGVGAKVRDFYLGLPFVLE